MSELKPCPFCGGEAETFEDVSFHAETGNLAETRMFFCWCKECPALVSGSTSEEAVEFWNRRTSDE